jgi:hypothetical protein
MANAMDDDLVVGDLIKDKVGIGGRRHTPDTRVAGARAHMGVIDEKVDDLP